MTAYDAVDGAPPTAAAFVAAETVRRARGRIKTIAPDIAKSIFQVPGIDAPGEVVPRRLTGCTPRADPVYGKDGPYVAEAPQPY